MKYFLCLFALSLFGASHADDIIISPIKQHWPEVAVVIIQGSQFPNDRYVPLVNSLRVSVPKGLWAAVPDFPNNTPDESTIDGAITRVLSALWSQGMNKSTPLFIAGHSDGGTVLQVQLSFIKAKRIFLCVLDV